MVNIAKKAAKIRQKIDELDLKLPGKQQKIIRIFDENREILDLTTIALLISAYSRYFIIHPEENPRNFSLKFMRLAYYLALEELLNLESNQISSRVLVGLIMPMAKMPYYHESFLERWIVLVKPKVKEFNARETSSTLWSMAKINFRDLEVITSLISHASKIADTFSYRDWAYFLWSLAVMDCFDENLVELAKKHLKKRKGNVTDKLQILHAAQYWRINPEHFSLNENKVLQMYQFFPMTRISGFEKKVKGILLSMGLTYEQQVYINGFVLDFVLPNNFILECDGTRFHRQSNKLKDTLLQRLSYKVVHLDSDEFNLEKDKKLFIIRQFAPYLTK